MIAVVTGSSGFIGSHLVRQLLARGDTVRALVRPQSVRAIRDARVGYHEADLLNPCALANSPVWTGATHLFHLAGLTTATSLDAFRLGNVQPIANIMAALSALAAPPRIVAVSSQAAAGPARSRDTSVKESDPPAPIEAYGTSKREAERVLEACGDKLSIGIVRAPAVYGPGDRDFLEAFRQASHPVALHAISPEHWFDLVHVDDVVRALLLVAGQATAKTRTYFLSGDHPVRWRDLYDMVAHTARSKPMQIQVPRFILRAVALLGDGYGFVTKRTPLLNSQKLSLAGPEFWLCDSSRIRNELGWRPVITLQHGVRDTYLWYVDAGWLSRKQGVKSTL